MSKCSQQLTLKSFFCLDGTSAHMKMLSKNLVKSVPDVRLRCQNRKTISANKIVLSQSSKLLQKIFQRNCEDCLSPEESDLICPDFEFEALKKVLELVNTGKTFLQAGDKTIWNEIISIIDCLQINIKFVNYENLKSNVTPIPLSSSVATSSPRFLSSSTVDYQKQEIISEDSTKSSSSFIDDSIEDTRASMTSYR